MLGLARSGYDVPDSYYQDYYATVETYVKACDGKLHDKKYTEYSRVIVALSSIGKDARNVGGYDLTKPLGDYDKTIWQGLNGPIWALIALDSRDYPMPENPEAETQATRQMYIDRILECQLPDGGWSLFGGTSAASSGDGVSDPDITGMALQALAKYQDQPAVAKATEEALACMSKKQNSEGGFSSWGTKNSESCVQIIVALCELGIPLDDPRFVKNGNTLLDNLMTFYLPGKPNSCTRQTAPAPIRWHRSRRSIWPYCRPAASGRQKQPLPDERCPNHPRRTGDRSCQRSGIGGEILVVPSSPITQMGKTFDDITGVNAHKNQPAIEALAARGIIDGKSDGSFDPEGSMTRAEFAAIVVRALGLTPEGKNSFSDVAAEAWYAPYVGTAYSCGIITGVADDRFNPSGTITREEAAVMVSRAAKLCGLETEMDNAATRNMLAQFPDYMSTAEWARAPLAFCYQEKILNQAELNIRPRRL